jgi:hypothetical protein
MNIKRNTHKINYSNNYMQREVCSVISLAKIHLFVPEMNDHQANRTWGARANLSIFICIIRISALGRFPERKHTESRAPLPACVSLLP